MPINMEIIDNKNIEKNKDILKRIIYEVSKLKTDKLYKIDNILRNNLSIEGKIFSKTQILKAYRYLKRNKILILLDKNDLQFLNNIKMKFTRTISGVTPVTVLTKPYPCPGKCIFCPNDASMPKSYLPQEPGAQRAAANLFDPYYQTFNRLVALKNMGHPTDKIELIILGGTWSVYPEKYKIWFIKRCFDALNMFDPENNFDIQKVDSSRTFFQNIIDKLADSQYSYNQKVTRAASALDTKYFKSILWRDLYKVQKENETARCRCVGLVVETRPDQISTEEVINIRKIGATKVQIGVQNTNNRILSANKRGHTLTDIRYAVNLLRQAGLKLHIHWMPNLYKSTPEMDMKDFDNLFGKSDIKPDELKVYPCSLIAHTKLMDLYNQKKWRPYTQRELEKVLRYVFINTPRYCRITRVIRDIPGFDIVDGNKITNFRQIIEKKLNQEKIKINEIRYREIKEKDIDSSKLIYKKTDYETDVSKEFFLEYVTKDDLIAGFLRLSLPKKSNFIKEIDNHAMIREVHVYGQSIELGVTLDRKVQHRGLGKNLINQAQLIAKANGFNTLSVISSIGTRKYYENLGFSSCVSGKNLYQHKNLFK